MSAKEMFKKLGYEYSNNGIQICYFNDIENEYIWFYLETKTIEIQFDIYIEILQAINKQIEELGWNND